VLHLYAKSKNAVMRCSYSFRVLSTHATIGAHPERDKNLTPAAGETIPKIFYQFNLVKRQKVDGSRPGAPAPAFQFVARFLK